MSPRPRAPIEPACGLTWKILPAVRGLTADICSAVPKTFAMPAPTPVAADTCGRLLSRWASAGSIPPARPAPESITMSPAKLRLTAELIDAVVEEARMVMKLTRPTPIISAEALAAVRLGLRMAFSRASLPAMPRNHGSGAPTARLSGSDTVRPSTDTAKNTSSTPAPTTRMLLATWPKSPVNSAAMPAARMPVPTMIRCLEP
jgi:hypothetical protein